MADTSKRPERPIGWPFRNVDHGDGDLLNRLIRVGAHHARRARTLCKTEEYEDHVEAAIGAGVALEMISKACIARINPALLAGNPRLHNGVQKAILVLTGSLQHSKDVPKDVNNYNTISVSEAVTAARNFDKQKQLSAASTDDIIKARDAAMHIGFVDSSSIEKVVNHMATFIDGALDILDVHKVAFWGSDSDEDVTRMIADFSAREEQRVRDKIDAAFKRYQQFYEDFDNANLARMAELNRLMSTSRLGSESVPEMCPACQNEGEYEVYEDIEFDFDGKEHVVTDHWVIDNFECPFCRLKLEHDELNYADLEDDGDELMAQLGNPNNEDYHMEQARGL